jgi:hypothetical protein
MLHSGGDNVLKPNRLQFLSTAAVVFYERMHADD